MVVIKSDLNIISFLCIHGGNPCQVTGTDIQKHKYKANAKTSDIK